MAANAQSKVAKTARQPKDTKDSKEQKAIADDKAEKAAARAAALAKFKERHPYMQNRELSWLEFNKRVLDLGQDPTVPLLERLNFVSIYWSNLQEFFMVRVGSLTDLALLKKEIIDQKSGMTPTEQLDAIYTRARELYPDYQQAYCAIRELLSARGIENLHGRELTPDQAAFAQDYFDDNVLPFLSPQIINTRHPFPHLENGALYIVVRLNEEQTYCDIPANTKNGEGGEGDRHGGAPAAAASAAAALPSPSQTKGKGAKSAKGGKGGKDAGPDGQKQNRGAKGVTLGLIPLPKQCDRIVQLPGKDLKFMLLEHLIEHFAAQVFSMYKIKHTNIICVTRNADLDATEGSEEQGEDYREHMKKILKKRKRLAPVRLESERELSATVKAVLLERLQLSDAQTFVTSVPLDMSYTYDLAPRIPLKKRNKLINAPFTPAWPASLNRNRSIIEQLHSREVLLNYPYQSMSAFVQLLREAALDPAVISIKITLYRLAKQSHVAEALIAAAEAGKEVTAVFELRARFDESNNIDWSQRLEQAGCNVLYGYRNYKIHSKICVISRRGKAGLEHITQIGTGNYNEKTAALYTDFSFMTTDDAIGRDAMHYFHNIALENISDDYDILWVSPLQIKQNIMAGIDDQIARARAGEAAGLFFKTNSITDRELIEKIVEASQAGVACTLLVRGISCVLPGIAGFTDNVRVVSIVGRLLEHSRIYVFGPINDVASRVYMSSADLMTRNMDKRVEVAWPILNDALRTDALDYIKTCLADTAKLRELLPNGTYTPARIFTETNNAQDGEGEGEGAYSNTTGNTFGDEYFVRRPNYTSPHNGKPFDAQKYLIQQAQQKHIEAATQAAAQKANRTHGFVSDIDNKRDCASEGLRPSAQNDTINGTSGKNEDARIPQGDKYIARNADYTSPAPASNNNIPPDATTEGTNAPSAQNDTGVETSNESGGGTQNQTTRPSPVPPPPSPLRVAGNIIGAIGKSLRALFKK